MRLFSTCLEICFGESELRGTIFDLIASELVTTVVVLTTTAAKQQTTILVKTAMSCHYCQLKMQLGPPVHVRLHPPPPILSSSVLSLWFPQRIVLTKNYCWTQKLKPSPSSDPLNSRLLVFNPDQHTQGPLFLNF